VTDNILVFYVVLLSTTFGLCVLWRLRTTCIVIIATRSLTLLYHFCVAYCMFVWLPCVFQLRDLRIIYVMVLPSYDLEFKESCL
jgi:hypothetical protein